MAGLAGIEPTTFVSKTKMISVSPKTVIGTRSRNRTYNSRVKVCCVTTTLSGIIHGGREESRTPKALLTLGGFQDRFRHQSICSSIILVPAEGIEPSQER